MATIEDLKKRREARYGKEVVSQSPVASVSTPKTIDELKKRKEEKYKMTFAPSETIKSAKASAELKKQDTSLMTKRPKEIKIEPEKTFKLSDALNKTNDIVKNIVSPNLLPPDFSQKEKLDEQVSGILNTAKSIFSIPGQIVDVETKQEKPFVEIKNGRTQINMPKVNVSLEEDFKESFASGSLASGAAAERVGSFLLDGIGLDKWAERLSKRADEDLNLQDALNKQMLTVKKYDKFSNAIQDPEFLANGMAQNFPNLLATLGLTTGLAVGGVPGVVIGGASFLAGSVLEGGFAANDAKAFGADEETQKKVALVVGVANGLLESLLPTSIALRNPAMSSIKKSAINYLYKDILKIAEYTTKDALKEGTTESLQELVSNAVAKASYDEQRNITQGVPEAFTFGSLTGAGASTLNTVQEKATEVTKEGADKLVEFTKKFVDTTKQIPGKQGGYIKLPDDLFNSAKKAENAESFAKNYEVTPEDIKVLEQDYNLTAESKPEEITTALKDIYTRVDEATKTIQEQVEEKIKDPKKNITIVDAQGNPVDLPDAIKKELAAIATQKPQKTDLQKIIKEKRKAREEEPLIQEARKYNSAEEFISSQPVYFHSTKSENIDSINKNGFSGKVGEMSKKTGGSIQEGVFLYDSKNSADVFGKNFKNPTVIETSIVGKVYDATKLNKYGWEEDLQIQEIAKDRNIIDQLKKDGYVGVKSTEMEIPASFVFVPSAVKTKSQLTDIWNKAAKTKKNLEKTTPIKKKIAQTISPVSKANIYKTDKQLLRQSVAYFKQSFNKGFKFGTAEAKYYIGAQFRAKEITADIVRESISQYASYKLRLIDRGRILNKLRLAKTKKDLYKVYSTIDDIAIESETKRRISKIKKLAENIPANIDVDYKNKIKDIIDTLTFKTPTAVTKQKLEATKKFIESEQAKGNDVTVPKYVLESLEILDKTDIKDLSISELSAIQDRIESLIELGKTKERTEKNLYEIEKEKLKEQILPNVIKLEKHPLVTQQLKELSFGEKLQNAYSVVRNSLKSTRLSFMPQDSFIDMMGGGQGTYDNPFYNAIKGKYDLNKTKYLNMKDSINERINSIIIENKLNRESLRRIGIHAAREQENGTEKLKSAGYTQELIDSVQLNKEEFEVYDAMRKELDALAPQIRDITKKLYNEDLGNVKNYFPFVTDFTKLDEVEMFRRFGLAAEQFGKPAKKKVEKGFTKERVGDIKQAIDIDAFDVFTQHIDNASYLINIARDHQMVFEIINSQEFKDKAGELGTSELLKWADLISRKGGVDAARKVPVLDFIRRNAGVALLGYKLSTIAVQFTALADGSQMIGSKSWTGFSKIISSQEARDFVFDNMPEIRDRTGDDPAYLNMPGGDLMKAIQEGGMKGIKVTDRLTATGVAYGAYEYKMEELGLPVDYTKPNKEAIQFAQKVVRLTQSTSDFASSPSIASRGGLTGNLSVDKALSQFQSFVFKRWDDISYKFPSSIKRGDYKSASRIGGNLILAVVMEEFIRHYLKVMFDLIIDGEIDPDEAEKEFNILEKVMKGISSNIPMVSNLVGVLEYSSAPIPLLGVFDELGRASQQMKADNASSKTQAVLRYASALGQIFGVPGTIQAKQILIDLTKEYMGEPEKKSSTTKKEKRPSSKNLREKQKAAREKALKKRKERRD